MNEVLSRREDKKLVKALQAAAYNDHPNPTRIGCPTDINILKALAAKKLHVTDPVIQHVAECSPCFREVMELRCRLKRLRVFKILGGVAALTIFSVALASGYKNSP
ncbi:MAG: hypothetical protein JO340_15210 [Acidobacteriaceae bacterium]|nr:hypothetical protein [Acidobacteriaceae bacterium]